MFLLMGIGYVLYKKNLITQQGSKDMGTILLYVISPCIIMKSFLTEATAEKAKGLALSFLVAAIALLLSTFVSRFVFGQKHRIEHFGTAYSNAGFIGIPLVQATIGNEAVFYISAFIAILNILQWTYGVSVITGSKDSLNIKNIIKNPVVISLLLGILLFIIQPPIPFIIDGTLDFIGNMNAPLAMIVLGVYLAQADFVSMFTEKVLYKSSIIRLVVIPLLTIALISLMPAQYNMIKFSILIVASGPVGANVAVFAQLNNLNYSHAVKLVCLSTILSIITMPIMIALAASVW
jgi:predicted permease